MLRGWALADHGQVTEGLAQMQRGFADWQANGQELGKTRMAFSSSPSLCCSQT